jgi:hypothetical protein
VETLPGGKTKKKKDKMVTITRSTRNKKKMVGLRVGCHFSPRYVFASRDDQCGPCNQSDTPGVTTPVAAVGKGTD